MANKSDYQKWGKIFTIIGGILFIVGGVLLILSHFSILSLNALDNDMVAKGFILSYIPIVWLVAIIQIVIGIVSIGLPTSDISDLVLGIVLIVMGIIGIGIPGLFVFIGGVLYIIASTKKR